MHTTIKTPRVSRFSLENISNFSGLSAEEVLKLKEGQE